MPRKESERVWGFNMTDFKATGDPFIDIPALIKSRGDGLTFVELLQYIPYLKGGCAYGMSDRNIIYWNGLSEQCISTLAELINSRTVRITSTMPLTYMIDGVVPNLPVAKSNRVYKNPHWAPVTFGLPRKAA
jgi:hypothetical protein